MRNWNRRSGVYSNMHRAPLFLICSLVALGQDSPRKDPLDTAIQAVWQARNSGRFEEAAAAREQARALLQRVPVDSRQLTGWVHGVAQSYQLSNLNAQARAVLQESLARTKPLGASHPSHVSILTALGESWRQDGNLLKAVDCLEKAAAVSTPASAAAAQRAPDDSASSLAVYAQLANLYEQLGRPDAVAAIALKMRTLASDDPMALAQFYERHGQFEEAAASYKMAEESADPYAKAGGWQMLAGLYARQERYIDAIDATRQAIAAVQPADDAGNWNQILYQDLAGYLGHAGLLEQGDQVYRQLLQQYGDGPQATQVLNTYAQYLADTKRGAQGESVLQDYLAGGSPDAHQRAFVLYNLANLAIGSGDSQRAGEYRQAAQALQPQPPAPLGQFRIAEDLQTVQAALGQSHLDEAYTLALHVLDAAAQASDGRQAAWVVPQIANTLAANKEPDKAQEIFARLFALAQAWSTDSAQPLITVTQSYARFLMSQTERLGEVPAAIEQFRRVLADANGPDSATLVEPLQMSVEFERSQMQWDKADASARELLQLQESLSGNTSEAYLRDLQTAAQVYDAAGDSARALPLRRNAITIADLLATPNTFWRRSETRIDAALTLARLGQFDEAEALGEEAVAMQRTIPTPRPPLEQQLEQIRGMKRDAANASRVEQ